MSYFNSDDLASGITSITANVVLANSIVYSANGVSILAGIPGTYTNSNVSAYLPSDTTIIGINANVAGANAAIVTANTAMKGYVDYNDVLITSAWTANAASQEGAITSLHGNITAANAAIQTLSANVGSFYTWANTNFGTSSYSNTNVSAYLSTVTAINIGNIRIVDQTISSIVSARPMTFNTTGGADFVFNSNIMPSLNYVYTLGSKTRRWAKSYHGPKSIDIDGILIETDTDVGGSNIYIGNAAIFNAPSITSNSVMVATGNITGGNLVSTFSTFLYGQLVTGYNSLYAGVQNGYTELPSDVAQFTGNGNTYVQINSQNISSGGKGTVDFVGTSNDGTDTTYYVDLGIAGSGYANATPSNSLGTSLWPRDSYLYAQGNTAANIGGNLVIGTTTPTKTVKIIAGGVNSTNIVSTFTSTGLTVAGNVSANYFSGDGSKLTATPMGSSIIAGLINVNPASVGKNTVATQTFTITGLTTSHKINLTPGTALTYGIFISAAWASATNTVSVQFMNISGASIDLGAIDLEYIAWI